MTITHAYMPITKAEKQTDGTLLVEGKATGPDLDLDQQICDADWLAKAMPQWFETGANVREMHQPIAAGVGRELAQDGESWNLRSLIVDRGAIAKFEAGVYQGYSIGIRSPKVVKDASAPGGRICGGTIVEVSVVDRPANPTCTVMLAKAAGAEDTLELVEVEPDATKDVGGALAVNGSVDSEDAVEGAADEAGEDDLVAQARSALVQLLEGEAEEVAAGVGGTGPVRVLVQLLDDLSWFEQLDASDDAVALMAAGKAAQAEETTMNLTTIADLVKAATADDATDEAKNDVDELRKALGVDNIESITEQTTATAEATKALEERVAKVEQTVAPGGPMRMVAIEVSDAKNQGRLSKAAEYRRIAKTIADPDMAAAYKRMAADLENA